MELSTAHKHNRTFGEYLRSRRIKADLTIREVSTRTGLSIGILCNLELDKHAAKLPTLEKLATVFGESVPMFLSRYYSSPRTTKRKKAHP